MTVGYKVQGLRIQEARVEAGLTQIDVAIVLGIHEKAYSRIECNAVKMVDGEILEKLGELFHRNWKGWLAKDKKTVIQRIGDNNENCNNINNGKREKVCL